MIQIQFLTASKEKESMLKFFDKSLLRVVEELSINAKAFNRPLGQVDYVRELIE